MTISYDPYLSAVFAELKSISDPFAQNLEKLEEVINRSERDDNCPEEVAQNAREEVGLLRQELNMLILKTYLLHEALRVLGTITAPAHSRAALQ